LRFANGIVDGGSIPPGCAKYKVFFSTLLLFKKNTGKLWLWLKKLLSQ